MAKIRRRDNTRRSPVRSVEQQRHANTNRPIESKARPSFSRKRSKKLLFVLSRI
jgi:hypothetical protein